MHRHRLYCLIAGALALLSGPGPAQGAPASPAATAEFIPYEKFRLDNGLTVIVHTDRKAPIVAVDVWYHVGSKNEKPGKTGFAHLFEHLMFQGTEHYREDYHRPFEQVGVTEQNGTTYFDRTNYFETVPTTALDLALWMESDRMGHLLGAIDQARLDLQRGVVQNEKRQGENRPYGRVMETIFQASFPVGHPYHWLPIGSMEDLNAASLEDVKDWFRSYYGAANAVLVLAGDIDVATARQKVQQYFGDIPPGPAITRPGVWIAARTESRRDVIYDQVAQVRLQKNWNTPPQDTAEADLLELVANILGSGKNSRLYDRLVYRDQIADSVSAAAGALEIAGLFSVSAEVKKDIPSERVERAIAEEMQRFLDKGPTPAELERAQMTVRADFIRGLERIGGFGGKADVLASCEVYEGDPGCYARSLDVVANATSQQLRDVARRWLTQGDYTLEVRPQPAFRPATSAAVDRAKGPPATTSFPDLVFPDLKRAKLHNGLPVVIATRPGVPVVRVSLLFDAGFAADQGRRPGTSSFAMTVLGEGTARRGSLEIADRAKRLGAEISSGAGLDTAVASLSALHERLDESLTLFADIVRNPSFPQREIDRVRGQWLAGIAQEKTRPNSLALRVLPPLLYGPGHPYAIPFTGTGTESSIAALTRDDLVAFQRDCVRPDNATLIVTGDTTPGEILPLLEKYFGDWAPPSSPRPATKIADAPPPAAPRVFLLDRPDAIQTNILVGQLMNSSLAPERLETETMNKVLGGTFTSRINMNLREDKHWTYGAGSVLPAAIGQRPWILFAPVQTDKTVEAMREIRRELEELVGSRPATAEEIAKIRNGDVRELPGRYETNAAVGRAISEIVTYRWPDDYVRTLKSRIEAQTDDAVRAAARASLRPAAMTWVLVGDLKKIEQPIRELKLGEVKVLDRDGAVLR